MPSGGSEISLEEGWSFRQESLLSMVEETRKVVDFSRLTMKFASHPADETASPWQVEMEHLYHVISPASPWWDVWQEVAACSANCRFAAGHELPCTHLGP